MHHGMQLSQCNYGLIFARGIVITVQFSDYSLNRTHTPTALRCTFLHSTDHMNRNDITTFFLCQQNKNNTFYSNLVRTVLI